MTLLRNITKWMDVLVLTHRAEKIMNRQQDHPFSLVSKSLPLYTNSKLKHVTGAQYTTSKHDA